MGDVKEALNFIRVSLTTTKKAELKRLGDKINDLQWYTVRYCRLSSLCQATSQKETVTAFNKCFALEIL